MLLMDEAIKANKNSYSPYSNFKVSAALLMADGKIVTGFNIENISYGLSMCAERVAIYHAYALGYKKDDIKEMAIYANTIDPISPCGACRQVMIELLNTKTKLYLVNKDKEVKEVTVGELLPYSFSKLE